jgi:myosin heavy subunit
LLAAQAAAERNYHIFYNLLTLAADSAAGEYQLASAERCDAYVHARIPTQRRRTSQKSSVDNVVKHRSAFRVIQTLTNACIDRRIDRFIDRQVDG